MAWQVSIPRDGVKEINGTCVIDAVVEDTVKQKTYPYHVVYTDVEQITNAQLLEDVTNFARMMASKGNAIDVLRQQIEGRTFPLDVTASK